MSRAWALAEAVACPPPGVKRVKVAPRRGARSLARVRVKGTNYTALVLGEAIGAPPPQVLTSVLLAGGAHRLRDCDYVMYAVVGGGQLRWFLLDAGVLRGACRDQGTAECGHARVAVPVGAYR